MLVWSCTETPEVVGRGAQLSRIYGASCHQYPEPELLDRPSWENHMLPRMGYLMGVLPKDSVGSPFFEEEIYTEMAANPHILRTEATLSRQEWQEIRSFYLAQAPDRLARPNTPKVAPGLRHFTVRIPEFRLSPPSTTLIKTDDNAAGFFIGDAHKRKIYRINEIVNHL